MATTFEQVRDIIVDQLDVDPDEVTENAKFKEDLDADSLDLVELIMSFEESLGRHSDEHPRSKRLASRKALEAQAA